MKYIRLFILLFFLIFNYLAYSQISHGGIPYFLQPSILTAPSGLRVASESFYIEMPTFNLDSVLREDALNSGNMRGSLQFAHKFYTHIDINDGIKTVLPDGTTVWQIGIHSAGAYSINLLLRDFEIPPGGKLFIYNADHSYVAGSFDDRNNPPEKIFPIQPVAGESIIVEYSEPANVPFKGHFFISEVNHDYRDIFRAAREPYPDGSSVACMPDVLCSDAADITVRSTVLLIINGNTACTGSLLNNTSNDGKPYLLTAVHCFVDNPDGNTPFPTDMNYYNARAMTAVAFFNYNRPVCDVNIKMKGSEEMSLAGATARVFLPRKDIAILEFFDSPPIYYNAYYAGWNRDLTATGNHTNIHHPNGALKKYGMTDKIISLSSPFFIFDSNSFWEIPSWTNGSTASGSSGSPLFDENNLIIGGLTSGYSECSGSFPSPDPNKQRDFFSSFGKGWETDSVPNPLKTCLDPVNTGVLQCQGIDPNQANPVIRLKNANYTGSDSLITSKLSSPHDGYVFGSSDLQTTEFAEAFTVADPVEIYGVYLLLPTITYTPSTVKIYVYTGDSSPAVRIDSATFVPQYIGYSTGAFSPVNKTLNTVPTENFIKFNNPVLVTAKKFYISYSINSSAAQFYVYNTKFQNASQLNTAWVKDVTKGWVTADAYDYYKPAKTSLAIQPLLQNWNGNQIETIAVADNNGFYYERSMRTLTLREPVDAQGQIAVYSVSGQLLEKMPIQQGQTSVVLRERPQGTIGIVKITSNISSCVGKIIY